MLIKYNMEAIKELMKKRGIATQEQLLTESGIDPMIFWNSRCKCKNASLKRLYLIADRLDCHIDDIITVDWEGT